MQRGLRSDDIFAEESPSEDQIRKRRGKTRLFLRFVMEQKDLPGCDIPIGRIDHGVCFLKGKCVSGGEQDATSR